MLELSLFPRILRQHSKFLSTICMASPSKLAYPMNRLSNPRCLVPLCRSSVLPLRTIADVGFTFEDCHLAARLKYAGQHAPRRPSSNDGDLERHSVWLSKFIGGFVSSWTREAEVEAATSDLLNVSASPGRSVLTGRSLLFCGAFYAQPATATYQNKRHQETGSGNNKEQSTSLMYCLS